MPDDRRLVFIIGGARSGKSAHAERLIEALPAPWTYLATGQAFDAEMEDRIAEHKARRDQRWRTIEAPLELATALRDVPEGELVLVDCLTLWLSNQILAERDVAKESARLVEVLAAPRGPWFAVSNEVGLGIVPDNALARRFRDAAGRLNQEVAAVADEVLLMAAGLPIKVK